MPFDLIILYQTCWMGEKFVVTRFQLANKNLEILIVV